MFLSIAVVGGESFANLFENVPFASRFDGAVPPVVPELLLAVCHREFFGVP